MNEEDMNEQDIEEMAAILDDLAFYEGTEVGETWRSMYSLWVNYPYISETLKKALASEITTQYNFYKENYELKETTVTHTTVEKELVWKGD